jgi:hypothetical protein
MNLHKTTYEMVGKFEAGQVCTSIFKINDHKLLVLIGREQQRRLPGWNHPQKVTILSLPGQRKMREMQPMRTSYIVVCEDQLLLYLVYTTVLFIQPFSILVQYFSEFGPLRAAHVWALFHNFARLFLSVSLSLDPCDNLGTSMHPFVYVTPDKRIFVALMGQQIDSFVELSHALSNLLGDVCIM